MFIWFSLNRDSSRINPKSKGRWGGGILSLCQKEGHKSPLCPFFYYPSPSSYQPPFQKQNKTKIPPNKKIPLIVQSENNLQWIFMSFYLALECMFLCSMSRNWTNSQLLTMGRKPIPSPSSLLALTIDGSNPVPKEKSFLCLQLHWAWAVYFNRSLAVCAAFVFSPCEHPVRL